MTELFNIFNDFYEGSEKRIDKKYVMDLEQKNKEQAEEINFLKGEIKEYEKILTEKDKIINELKEKNIRMQADYQNFERILKKQKDEFVKYAVKDILKDLIVIKEDLERALIQNEDDDGIKMILDKLNKLLKKEGVEEINSVGTKFDFNKHEVLLAENSDEDEGTILEEYEKGYMFKDKVLKPAKVKICKKSS
ncbi:MAG: nucleotide exchange factor GrpE [Candidatus Helarchaeota archaeon]